MVEEEKETYMLCLPGVDESQERKLPRTPEEW